MAQQAIRQQVAVPAAVTVPAGMTAQWFEQAVARSFEKDLQVKALGSGTYAMRSSRDERVSYVVTAHSCGCEGNKRFGRCYHRARAAFEDWSGNEPGPSAPAAPPVPALPEVVYALDLHVDGTAAVVEFVIHGWGRVSRRTVATYPDADAARAALAAIQRRRERGPVRTLDCPVCAGWGCDHGGRPCARCQGRGEVLAPVPSVAALIAAGAWPGETAAAA